ncbi:MAG: hypothetical protein GY796_26935 [Chloroflexi bacterium]|nr:hypothetical protein [Chloroflexota bacterium]
MVRGSDNCADVFVRDRYTGQTSRISVASNGAEGNRGSFNPTISADGQIIAFPSDAANLVLGDHNDARDIFIHDRETGQTTRISTADDGTEGNADSYRPVISADGRFVTFRSYADNLVSGDTNNQCDSFSIGRPGAV